MTSLAGPTLKVRRALEHFNALEAQIKALTNGSLYTVARHVDHEAGEQFWRLESDPPVIPDVIPLLVGDCLYNFASALDHLVWQLVLSNGNIPDEKNEFPIFDCPSKYKAGKQRRLNGVSQSAVAIIDGLQPYNTGNPALSRLRILSNTDKHRHLHITIVHEVGHTVNVSLPADGLNSAFEAIEQITHRSPGVIDPFGPIEKGAKLYSIKNTDVEMGMTPIFKVVFSDFESQKGLVVVDEMIRIQGSVKDVFAQLSLLF